ncbi:DUF6252 family protein [Flavobacterium piscisymbiosum]|uniref:DUF6252 family protein n=1 Tax=Flavobacterium piscisymbiosum TaxID=2893753 RepID=A0ABS8MII6_9FLAO|nr:DUF6252 family protein [Flavobacterium sp. F-30]MCC9065304.1 DUF6252 family protein [Flavobacterium sp. F-30]
MKKNYILFLLLFALGISFTSCTKDFEDGLNYNNGNQEAGNGNGNNPAGTGVFKATVGGNAFVANGSSAIVTDNFVLIAGIRTSNKDLIQITLPSNKVGTYTWANSKDDGEKFVLSYGSVDTENPFISASNEVAEFFGVKNYTDTAIVTITAVDKTKKTISGTFQFTGFRDLGDDKTETKIITNGSFTNIPYTETAPVEESDGFLNAKIDGVDFVENDIDVASVSSSGVYPYFSIVGAKNGGNEDSVRIGVSKSYGVGTYQASSVTLNGGGEELVNVANASCTLDDLLYTTESGSLTITSKTATKIEGTFNFVVSNFTTGKKKTITGSFGINTEDL